MLIVHRCAAHGMMPHAGEHAERYGRSGRPSDGGPHLRDGLPAYLRTEMDGGHLAHAALAGALAQLGKALDQLDVPHAGIDRLRHVVAGDIHAETGNGIRRIALTAEEDIG
jgi:hypothetical protein